MQMNFTEHTYFLMIVIVSFIGFVFENLCTIFVKGCIENRNLFLPFLLGYGASVMGCYLLLGIPQPENMVWYFTAVFVLVSLGEILSGKFVEYFCGFSWWDYTAVPLHITRYTSVPTSIGFAVMITFFMRKCFLPLMRWTAAIPQLIAALAAKPLFVLLLADLVVSFQLMCQIQGPNDVWRVQLVRKKYKRLPS